MKGADYEEILSTTYSLCAFSCMLSKDRQRKVVQEPRRKTKRGLDSD